jgi:hypothetical protein
MREEYKKANENITLLTTELTAARKDINALTSRVDKIEKEKHEELKMATQTAAKLNALEQRAIDTQLSISNVPACLDTDKALAELSNWSNIKLDETAINRAAITTSKNKTSSNLQIDFANINTKARFMRFVKTKQKNENKKYIPILAEHIFGISDTNTARGLELSFRDQFTEVNKKIFNKARDNKNIFTAVWKSQGYIYCKSLPEDKPIRILSLEHLQLLIKSKQNNSMECDE